MKSASKSLALLLCFALVLCSMISCATAPSPSDDPSTEDPTSENPPSNETVSAISPLTGLACEVGDELLRPVAFMIDNEVNYFTGDYHNLGICEADLIFETNIESNGSGTRLMAVFNQDALSSESLVIGGVRSARPYFLQLAKMLDAYYVHEGSSSTDDALPSSILDHSYYARPMLHSGYVDSYELEAEGIVSFRPESDLRKKLCVVSSAVVANADDTLDKLQSIHERNTYEGDTPTPLFSFGKADLSTASDAAAVRVRFSDGNRFYTQSKFTYNAELGEYVRSQYLYQSSLGFSNNPNPNDVTSTDVYSGKTLNFKNVFVLSTNQYAIDADYSGTPYHTKIDLIGYEGEGYYFTEGKCVPVTWKCESDSAPIRYFTEDGKELTVNPGKTYVNLIHQNAWDDLEITAE